MKPLLLPVPSYAVPTATTVPSAKAVTPASVFEPEEVAFGLAMMLQLVASQCSSKNGLGAAMLRQARPGRILTA